MPDCFRFPASNRLRKKIEIQQVLNSKNRRSSRFFVAYIKPNDGSKKRLGIIVRKANIKNAVDRNRIKRLIREYFRLNQNKISGIDLVIVVKKGADLSSHHELFQCLEQLLSRL